MEKNATLHCQFSGKQANTTTTNKKNTAEPIVRQEARAHSGLAAPGQAAGGAGGVIRSHMPSPSECPLCGGPGNFLLQKSIQTGFCLSVWAGWVLERSNTM